MRLTLLALSFVSFTACGKPKPPAPDAAPVDTAPAPFVADAAATAATADVAAKVEDTKASDGGSSASDAAAPEAEFKVLLEQFADLRILRYRVPGWDELTPKVRVLLYHFAQASLWMRDIIWDQNHPQGLLVRKTLEAIDATYKGDRTSADYKAFEVYLKRVWFSSGFYHHYNTKKLEPGFPKELFAKLVAESDPAALPLAKDETPATLADRLTPLLFDPGVEPMGVSLDTKTDLITHSGGNFYARGITQKEVEDFYAEKKKNAGERPLMFGLNSKLVKREDGAIEERVWKVGGMYGAAIAKALEHLEAALPFTENDAQKAWLEALIAYYMTGELEKFDAFCIAWVKDTESTVDMIHGFIESYGDPLDMRGSYEAMVQVRDPAATRRIAAISREAQWFEDHMPYLPEHKKPDVKGISARVIDIVIGTGDAGPSMPIGVNLPNSEWIRKEHGSKSVTNGNLMGANEEVKKVSGVLEEFAADEVVLARLKKHSDLADKLKVDMHEVIGHASGKLEDGVQPFSDTLKNYAGALEEARADLVALYFVTDPKLTELGLVGDPDVGKAAYDVYITSAMLVQLARMPLGADLQEAHMRNRQMVASWAIELAGPDVVAKIEKAPGKHAYLIKDYAKLREVFGTQLKEIQRIKSRGDFAAGSALIETYGIKIDPEIHKEVKERWDKLGVAPYTGFVNPRIVPVEKDGAIVDAKLEYVDDFGDQMREYAKRYAILPVEN